MTLDLDPIKARAEAASGATWHWAGNTDTQHLYLATWIPGQGRCVVMDARRWGMQRARFQFNDGRYLVNADDLAVYEVARNQNLPDDTPRSDPRVYRGDVVGIRHPDAEFIAHAREDIPALLAEVERLRGHLDAIASAATVPYPGPGDTDASFMLGASRKIEAGYQPGGSNVTRAVVAVLAQVARYLEHDARTPGIQILARFAR